MSFEAEIERAARAIEQADALMVAAGAGMGVDSGLPDFRGNEGFWQAYPPFKGKSFTQIANGEYFLFRPEIAWGFYGHRLQLYRETVPHRGFQILREWAGRMRLGASVFTSNVDGQFQKAGFDPDSIHEVHGSIHFLQCTRKCGAGIFPADDYRVDIDPDTFRARPPLPACPECDKLARPNILMFEDYDWDRSRSAAQEHRQDRWVMEVRRQGGRLVVVECGAGRAIRTVRQFSEELVRQLPGTTLIRINPREPETPPGQIGIGRGALAALEEIKTRLG